MKLIKTMLNYNFLEINSNFNKIGFFVLIINIIFYLLIFFFFILFFFFFNLFKLKNLNELKKFNTNNFILNSFLLSILSFSGMPPLIGFFSKFIMVIFFMLKNYFFFIFMFFFLNIFLLFFYIQNLKYLIKKKKHFHNNINLFLELKPYTNLNYLVFFSFLNISVFFFLDFFFIFIQNIIIF